MKGQKAGDNSHVTHKNINSANAVHVTVLRYFSMGRGSALPAERVHFTGARRPHLRRSEAEICRGDETQNGETEWDYELSMKC